MRTNALGTLYVNEIFFETAGEGSAIVNVASMAAHLLPEELIPTAQFPLAFHRRRRIHDRPAGGLRHRSRRGALGYRVRDQQELRQVVQPVAGRTLQRSGAPRRLGLAGSIDTEMGRLEEQAGAGAMVADAAVPRWGKAEEMAELLAFCASTRAAYLTGTDILNDGGVIASVKERARVAAPKASHCRSR